VKIGPVNSEITWQEVDPLKRKKKQKKQKHNISPVQLNEWVKKSLFPLSGSQYNSAA